MALTATWEGSDSASRAKMQGPCGAGYHVPTYAETNEFSRNWGGIANYLKFPFSGYRY